ncbi:MAG: AAA family ATPase [Desulfuromonadales bacterium C00003096]|nr:MAG: AAA family ATPase [Desulfuromonadales bacterium C00003096]
MPLNVMLKELRLATFSQNLESYQKEAIEKTWSYSEFLSKLCEQELARRFQTRISKWTREARLPAGKSFATLNFADLPKAVQQPIHQLKDNHQWTLQAGNVLLIGPSGVGKSHIAAALGYHLIERGIRVKWLSAGELVQQLQRAKKDLDLMTYMTRLDKYPVLIIDDIGYVKKSDGETQVLFEFIAHRYESGSLIVTSNQPFSQWDQIFPDALMTVAAVDRIIHHASIIEIEGDSYRKKQHLMK